MKLKITSTLLAILLVSFITLAQTIIPEGAVTGTWTLDNSPYQVEGAIHVPNGQTLIIEPGVIVKFNTTESFLIEGCLLAEGTAEDSILFTKHDIFTRWDGISWLETLSSNDSSKIAFCIFEHAYSYSTALGLNGAGAIAVKKFDKMSILNSTFRYNKVDVQATLPACGGAIGLWTSSIYISHCVFHHNEAEYGGAIIYTYDSHATTDNCLFYNNSASSYGGAVEMWDGSNPYIINCTFADNLGTDGGNTMDIYESMPNLTNSIVWNNDEDTINKQIHIRHSNSGLNVYKSNIQEGENGFSGETNNGQLMKMLDTIPCFMGDGAIYPYAIDTASPCANYGTLSENCLPEEWTCPDWDLAGMTRITGSSIDLGAYETQLSTGTIMRDATQNLQFNLFPNPTSSKLHIHFTIQETGDACICLYSINGQMVKVIPIQMKSSGQHQLEVDLDNLPGGYYFISLQSTNNVITKKVMKL